MTAKTTGNFLSTEGSKTVVYTRWLDDAPQGVLIIAHGMAEHIDRYDAFAQCMTSHGFAVYGNDHLGHGKTAKSEAELGFFADKDGYLTVIRDLYKLCEIAKKEQPGLPMFLLGHSMGSFLVRVFCSMYPSVASGVIIMGTGGHNPSVGAGIALTALLRVFQGKHKRSVFVNNIAFGSYCKKYENPRTSSDWLNTVPEEVDKYIADPLSGFLFTLSGYSDLFRLIKVATDKGWTDGIPQNLPILIVSGLEDPVGDFGKGVQQTFSDLHDHGNEDLSIILYENMRHEILNEKEKQLVYDDIVEWSLGHLPEKIPVL